MSGGFFFEHIVEYLLPKSDVQKDKKQKKSNDQKIPQKK